MRSYLIGSRRGRVVRALALGTVLTGVFATSVSAATTQVAANDTRTFSPSSVTVAVGGSVHWAASGFDDHSATQDQLLFNSGAPAAGLNFTRTFSAGTFPYHCEQHGDQGMRGVVRVPPKAVAGPSGLPFTVTWASAGSNTGSRFDVEYRVGSGAFKTWKSNTTARSAVFGARSAPVRVARGKSYSFRVVSRASTGARSAASPVKTFRAR
jgi:plastocyanin